MHIFHFILLNYILLLLTVKLNRFYQLIFIVNVSNLYWKKENLRVKIFFDYV